MKLAVSSVAFGKKSIGQIIAISQKYGWTIEFGSSMPFDETLEEKVISATIPRLIHNYFPPPKVPFVLNLASLNPDVRKISIEHCIRGLQITKKIKAPFYSAHAGFCGDPQPEELGRFICFQEGFNRTLHWDIFISSVQRIMRAALKLGVTFLIENNICAKFHLQQDESNPILCACFDDLKMLVDAVANPYFGLLLDTGHLKVSANTLRFHKERLIHELAPHIKSIHHNENNGYEDSNDKLNQGYWFAPFLNLYADKLHVLEIKNLTTPEIIEQINLINHLNV